MNYQQIFNDYLNQRPWRAAEANYKLLLETATRPLSVEALRIAERKLGDRLIIVREYEDGWRAFIAKHPQYDHIANREVGFQLLRGDEPTVENFEEIAAHSSQPFSLNAAAQQAQADVAERAKLIGEIVAGRKNFIVRTNTGQRIEYDAAGRRVEFSASGGRAANNVGGFEDMPLDEIRQLHAVVMEQRRLDGLSPQELKDHINKSRQQRYEDSSFSVRASQQPIVDSSGRAVVAPTGQTPAFELINPETGVQFTRRELIAFINKDRNNARLLLTTKEGRSKPMAARRLEEILRSNA